MEVAAARLWAAVRMPYLASALFAMTVVTESGSGRLDVDEGWQLTVDPVLVADLPVEELGAMLLHLLGHLVRDHAGRARAAGVAEENRRAAWNRAADAEINDDLATVPALAPDLPHTIGGGDGGLAEDYLGVVPVEQLRPWDCGAGADGRPGEGSGIAADQRELLRLSVAADLQRQHGTDPGSVPGGWLRWAEAVLPSKLDWRQVLAAEIRAAVAAVSGSLDYSYRRPSRRAHLTGDVVLPSMIRPVPEVAIVCDTSGSMDETLLAQALAEIEALLTRGGLRRTRVLAVDTDVQAVSRVTRAAQVELAGGGGTDMGEGIAAAAALRPRPRVIIVLTDGGTPWPDGPPAGARVVIGLLAESAFDPPAWARTVAIS